jgi:fluoride exporter
LNAYLIVGSGAFLGGALRHGVNQAMQRLVGPGLPMGTLTVNVVGCFAMGLVVSYFAFRGEAPQSLRLFLATGVLGGFTTFSAFSLDFALLLERGQVGLALAYAAASVVGSIVAIFAGIWLMRGWV